jgi:hypothetical protein
LRSAFNDGGLKVGRLEAKFSLAHSSVTLASMKP